MPFVKQANAHEEYTNQLALTHGARGQITSMSGEQRAEAQQRLHVKMPRADLVIVFPYKVDAGVKYGEAEMEEDLRGLRPPKDYELHKMEQWAVKRKSTLMSLHDAGIIMMLFYSRDRDEIFVKVSADEQQLRRVAEVKRHKLELKPQYLSAFAEYKNDIVGNRANGYSDRCVVSHLFKAHTDETDLDQGQRYPKPDAIFRSPDRIQLIDYMIRHSDHHCAGVDIGQLQHDGDVAHYFPLHENAKLRDMDKDWFRTFLWGTHVDKVRNYFGERIALYFLFLAQLNKWLVFPSIVGIALWIVDTIDRSPDNYTLIPFSLFVGIWTMLFMHSWRRVEATYSLRWGTIGMTASLEPTRPEFTGVSRINPVSGRIDRYYPWSERLKKVFFSWAVLSVTTIAAVFAILCLFGLRHHMASEGGRMTRLTFQFINAIVVEILNSVFTKIAKWLTDRENHRAYTEYANHLLAKTVIFKFVNCYISLYYIAFFKEHGALFGQPMGCHSNGMLEETNDCMNDVGSQLGVFMFTRLVLQNFVELCVPAIMMWWRGFKEGRSFNTNPFTNPLTVMPDLSTAEKQSKKETFDLFEDVDEILINYGYTVLFVVAAPWVPLVALIMNLVEGFLDQKKLVMLYRRPFPSPASTMEPWDTAFDVFGILAMMTNAAVVIFTSKAFEHWLHREKIFLFIIVEHVLVFTRVLYAILAPRYPQSVRLLHMQQQVVLHKHVNLGGEEDDSETRDSAMRTSIQPPPYVHDQDEEDMF